MAAHDEQLSQQELLDTLVPCCPDGPTQYLPSLVGHGPRTVTVHLGQAPAESHHPDTAPA